MCKLFKRKQKNKAQLAIIESINTDLQFYPYDNILGRLYRKYFRL